MPATDDLTAALKRSRQADRDKGRAIIQQRVLWDSLLEARIRLQKAATGSNRLPDVRAESTAVDITLMIHSPTTLPHM